MKRKLPAKPITQMNANELAQATKEFEREFVADSFGPPPARWSGNNGGGLSGSGGDLDAGVV